MRWRQGQLQQLYTAVTRQAADLQLTLKTLAGDTWRTDPLANWGLTSGNYAVEAMGKPSLAFDQDEYARRTEALRNIAAEHNIDLLWITTPEAICWLHGFFASWYKANSPMRYPQCYGTALHVESGRYIHFDNPSERPVLAKTSVSLDNRWLPSREGAPNVKFICDELEREGWLKGNVGVELWSYVPNRAVGALFDEAFKTSGCRITDASAAVRQARRVKSAAEIATIERAMEICDVGHEAITNFLRPGITELQLFGKVTSAMMEVGGEFPALIPIFCSSPIVDGRPASGGHGMAGRRVIEDGDFLSADLCGVFNRYHANVMRGYVAGKAPAAMIDRYRRAAGVFDVIRTDIKAGMTVAQVNERLRQYYDDVGLSAEPAGWALGYELGLSLPPDWVGEFYFHISDDKYLGRVFEENMVTNFESLFSTALIDTLVYEKDCTRILSKTPLELREVN